MNQNGSMTKDMFGGVEMFERGYSDLPQGFVLPDEIELLETHETGLEEDEPVWHTIMVDPSQVVFGDNIRAFNPEHVRSLALSMYTKGQIQSCIGEPLPDGRIAILAGQHRAVAAKAIMQQLEVYRAEGREDLKGFMLRVRIPNRKLTPNEILVIQISENIQNPMSPIERATATYQLWEQYRASFGKNATIAKLARMIGRSPSTVSDSLRFATLDPNVVEHVRQGDITYILGVQIAGLRRERQFPVTLKIIRERLRPDVAAIMVQRLINEDKGLVGLPMFDDEAAAQLYRNEETRIMLRRAIDGGAIDARGFMLRFLRTLEHAGPQERVAITEAVWDLLLGYADAFRQFVELLEEYDPKIVQEFERRLFGESNPEQLEE